MFAVFTSNQRRQPSPAALLSGAQAKTVGLMPASSGTASTSRRGSVASIDVGVSHMSGSVELEHDGVEGAAAAVGGGSLTTVILNSSLDLWL